MTAKHIGSSFDDFLAEDGLLEEASTQAVKRVLAYQIAKAMEVQGLTKSAMAKRMSTSRAQLDRLLDPANVKVQLDTIQRGAAAVGHKLRLELKAYTVAAGSKKATVTIAKGKVRSNIPAMVQKKRAPHKAA